jgi:hypothetical protein
MIQSRLQIQNGRGGGGSKTQPLWKATGEQNKKRQKLLDRKEKLYAVAQLVDSLRYKPEGREFDFRWCHCDLSLA